MTQASCSRRAGSADADAARARGNVHPHLDFVRTGLLDPLDDVEGLVRRNIVGRIVEANSCSSVGRRVDDAVRSALDLFFEFFAGTHYRNMLYAELIAFSQNLAGNVSQLQIECSPGTPIQAQLPVSTAVTLHGDRLAHAAAMPQRLAPVLAKPVAGDIARVAVGTHLCVGRERFPAASTLPHRCGLLVDDAAEAFEEAHEWIICFLLVNSMPS